MCCSGGGGGGGGRYRSSGGYSRSREAHAPSRPPQVIVTPMPRRSMFRDAAAIAGGVSVGTAVVCCLQSLASFIRPTRVKRPGPTSFFLY